MIYWLFVFISLPLSLIGIHHSIWTLLFKRRANKKRFEKNHRAMNIVRRLHLCRSHDGRRIDIRSAFHIENEPAFPYKKSYLLFVLNSFVYWLCAPHTSVQRNRNKIFLCFRKHVARTFKCSSTISSKHRHVRTNNKSIPKCNASQCNISASMWAHKHRIFISLHNSIGRFNIYDKISQQYNNIPFELWRLKLACLNFKWDATFSHSNSYSIWALNYFRINENAVFSGPNSPRVMWLRKNFS